MDRERPDVGRQAPAIHEPVADAWARVEPLVLGLMLQCNWAGDTAERLAFEVVYWERRTGDRTRDGA